MIYGTNIPADHFGIVTGEEAGIELGLKVHHRGPGGDPDYTTTDDYPDGVPHFEVEAGASHRRSSRP